MRYQETSFSCGAAAVVNVLRAFGIRVSERNIRSLAGTEYEGTGEDGIKAALRAYGLKVDCFVGDRVGNSWSWLHGELLHGRCAIICTDNSQHWVSVLGTLNDRIFLFDPTRTKANVRENGVHILSRASLIRRWRSRDADNAYFGISAGK